VTSFLNKRSGTQFYHDWKPIKSIINILHKNFQDDHTNSRRFPGFPVVDTLTNVSTSSSEQDRLSPPVIVINQTPPVYTTTVSASSSDHDRLSPPVIVINQTPPVYTTSVSASSSEHDRLSPPVIVINQTQLVYPLLDKFIVPICICSFLVSLHSYIIYCFTSHC